MYEKVCVTGGSGFVGKNLKIQKPSWTFLSSTDCDLIDYQQVVDFFLKERPDAIIHLAGRVGGIKENKDNQADFYYKNCAININVLQAAHHCGINRVLSSLSTCAFPNKVEHYPFSEEHFYSGPPAITNFSYGMAKRMLQVGSVAYRNQYNRNFSTFCPSNIYGPHDHFGEQSSHFVASLINKVHNAKDGDTIELWGTGAPLRQQLYVPDLCRLIPRLLVEHNGALPLIVAPSENLSIKEMTQALSSQVNKEVNFIFNGKLDGQFRKDGDNTSLKDIIPDVDFTKFAAGVRKTYLWFKENR